MSPSPPLIVLEGLDGAGTTTQTRRLVDHLRRRGVAVEATREPTDGPVGALVRKILAGSVTSGGSPWRPGERTMALLFAADRIDHAASLAAARRAGRAVVCDRYALSSMAYQALDPAIDPDWVVAINRGAAAPDLTIFVDVPVTMCLERLAARGDAASIYERRDLLERIAHNYRALADRYRAAFGPLEVVDGTPDADTVAAAVAACVRTRLGVG